MEGSLPTPQYEYDAEWRWPWWKFELMPDLLFTTLHERFNTRVCPIQDPHSFVCDVRACAIESPDVDTFYARLAERRDQRVAELEAVWSEVCSRMRVQLWSKPICGNPDCKSLDMEDKKPHMKNDKRFARSAALCHLSRTMAFNSLIDFFDGFVRDEREEEKRALNMENTGRELEPANDSQRDGPALTAPTERDDTPAGETARQMSSQVSHLPPTPSLSPKPTINDQINRGDLSPNREDVDVTTPPNPISPDEPETTSARGPNLPSPESGEAAETAAVSTKSQELPSRQLSRAQQKRKRNGPIADEHPTKRRATRRTTVARTEGPPRRSARLAR
ncbi:hypothetical protein B0J18DRAFT_413198 [Chaetomium sp. MPI-SDFR-AT-0129]|nr:hypothetical protein B0J18DRAFT_413198 [Chaetomium sp. MPI-SDFR-AT-0129]